MSRRRWLRLYELRLERCDLYLVPYPLDVLHYRRCRLLRLCRQEYQPSPLGVLVQPRLVQLRRDVLARHWIFLRSRSYVLVPLVVQLRWMRWALNLL